MNNGRRQNPVRFQHDDDRELRAVHRSAGDVVRGASSTAQELRGPRSGMCIAKVCVSRSRSHDSWTSWVKCGLQLIAELMLMAGAVLGEKRYVPFWEADSMA